ncbi:PIG-L deacetylase family protein [Colwellia sp. 75C3]|nr:PIG-L family deacetylase [Colwellia sp. 75C3]
MTEIIQKTKNRVLVIVAHADNETIGCGGTLLKHRDAGDEIQINL